MSSQLNISHSWSRVSPGFLDIQINGAYGFDFSIYDNDDTYVDGLRMVSEKIVETGVTRRVLIVMYDLPHSIVNLILVLAVFFRPSL